MIDLQVVDDEAHADRVKVEQTSSRSERAFELVEVDDGGLPQRATL